MQDRRGDKLIAAIGVVTVIAIVAFLWRPQLHFAWPSSGKPTPQPTPTLAADLAMFPLDDLPRKTADGNLIQIENAATGVVGPDRVDVAAVPLNGGGNRTYFLGLYGVRGGKPVQLQVLSVADLRDVAIHDGRIVVSTAALSAGDSYCCPSHLHRDVYSLVNGSAHLEAETLVAIATPTPQPLRATLVAAASSGEGNAASSTSSGYAPAGASCDDETLKFKSEDGDVLGTQDGRVFHVMPGDESEVVTWTDGDDLKVCGDKIINLDDRSSIEILP